MVYEPQKDSYLLLKYVKKLVFGRVLDMGTGSGILSISAAGKSNVIEVVGVDIDKKAIAQLRKRKIDKKIDKIKVLKSNLFSNVKGKFDVIVFNPPYLPFDDKDKDVAINGGVKGCEIIKRFLHKAKHYLNDKGFILLIFSNRTGKQEVDDIIKRKSYAYELLEKKSLPFFEELYAYKLIKAQEK